ncbi:hypothetical protein JR316_0012556 [Psilocybe cubensis]|uniref:Uncharacterized protein n=2 Tax=Psilocybe cubensis TaxID=181762 RepID=A0A8H7XN85_PSICU|nr:hypothetical protein JR316_0012556 [Psilocybe cubensis]KAH9475445.1 hypothetical protein JR316_0012556 [Psilocybe cubensis]
MEVSAIQPVVSPVPSAHNGRSQNKTRGCSTHTNKLSFSQTISSLKGIIRIPNRRKLSTPRIHFHSQSQDDADSTKSTSNPHFTSRPRPTHGLSHSLDTQAHLHSRMRSTGTAASNGSGNIDGIISDTEDYDKQQRRRSNIKNDPYAQFSRTAEGLNYTYKPYMSQPMLGAELSRGTGGDELVTGYDSESGSASGSGYGGGGRSPVGTGEGGGRTPLGFSATSPLALPSPSPSPTPVLLSSPPAIHPATEVAFCLGGKVEDTLIQVQHGDQGDEGEKEGDINDLYDGKAGGSLNNAAPSDTNTDTNTNTNIGTTANTAQSTTLAQISSSTFTPTSTIQTNSHARSNSPLPLLPLPDGPSSLTSASTSGAALRPRSSNGSGRTPAPRRALPPPPPESPISASSSASAALFVDHFNRNSTTLNKSHLSIQCPSRLRPQSGRLPTTRP